MVKKKNNVNLSKKKTKLKQRKEDKRIKKQKQNNFYYKYRKALQSITIVALIVLVSVSAYMMYQSSLEGKNTIELGDEVKFNFISYYDNGDIIQHTISSSMEDITVDTPLDGYQLKNPQRLPVGGFKEVSGMLIPLFWNDDMFVGMENGEEYTISIPAEWSYGGEILSPITEDERIFSVSRETETTNEDTLSYSSFVEDYAEPVVGETYEGESYPFTVTEYNESVVTFIYEYDIGDEIELEYGAATITDITDETVTAFYVGDMEKRYVSDYYESYLPVHIKETTDNELILEVEHYNYKIRVEGIEKNVIDADEWTIDGGDLAIARYIGYFEDGEVFDSSITDEGVEVTPDTPLDNTYSHTELYTTVQPGTTISGTQSLIDGFNDALIGMITGEEKIVEVLPEQGYGIYDEELVIEVNYLIGEFASTETISKTFTYTLEDYALEFGTQPFVDDLVELDYGLGQVISLDSSNVIVKLTSMNEGEFTLDYMSVSIIDETEEEFTIERLVEDGDLVYVSNGEYANASVEDGMILLSYDPEDYEVDGTFGSGTIIEKTDTYLVVDNNHALAGKTLYFKIKIMGFKKV